MKLRINDLVQECRNRHIYLNPDLKYKSKDYLKLLGEHELINYYNSLGNVDWSVKYRFNMESPMLSKNIKDISSESQQEVLNNKDGNWIAEHKIHGVRAIITYDPVEGFRFFGRSISLNDFLPEEYTDKILLIKNGRVTKPNKYVEVFPQKFVLDCEIYFPNTFDTSIFYDSKHKDFNIEQNAVNYLFTITDIDIIKEIQLEHSELQFKILDILYYQKDIRNFKLKDRRKLQDSLITNLSKYLPFNNSEWIIKDFQKEFTNYKNQGGEGLILKNINKSYVSSNSRKSDVQLKYKTDINELVIKRDLELQDLDTYISGYKVIGDYVSSLICSVFMKKLNGAEVGHEICTIDNIPLKIKKQITEYEPDNIPKFNKKYWGRVVSVNCKNFSKKELFFREPTVNSWNFRVDKTQFDCVIDEYDLIK